MVNYYKILKVSPKATTAEIKSAYRRLARKLHPDISKTADSNEDFAKVAKAYEVLSNPRERAHYDFQLSRSNGSNNGSDSVFHSDNAHAQKLRQMAYESHYNKIVDDLIDADRKETIALQKIIFPTVGLFVSIFAVAVLRPNLWANSEIIGKIFLLTLFIIGSLRFSQILREGLEKFTYSKSNLHDSIFEEDETVVAKPYSRSSAIIFLLCGSATSLIIGILLGNYVEVSLAVIMRHLTANGMKAEFIFYPPIVVLLVDIMHRFARKFEG